MASFEGGKGGDQDAGHGRFISSYCGVQPAEIWSRNRAWASAVAERDQARRLAGLGRGAEQAAGFLLLEAGQLGGLVIGRQMVGPLEQGLEVGGGMSAGRPKRR